MMASEELVVFPDLRSQIAAVANRAPGAVAFLACGKKTASYRNLLDQMDKTAQWLAAKGVRHADNVAVVMPNGPEMASLFLGVASVATCAPLNPAYRAKEYEFYLSDLKPKLVIVDAAMDSPVREVARAMAIEIVELLRHEPDEAGNFELGPEGSGGTPDAPLEWATAGDVALVLHTSGTTSRPKIVPLTHENLCVSAVNVAQSLALTASDRCLNIMPLFHIHGLVGAVLSSLSVGASVVCTPGYQATAFFDWLAEFHPTWYTGVPTMHQGVLSRVKTNRGVLAANRLRFIRSCSAALAPRVMAQLEAAFDVPVLEAYGMTEAAHQMACNPLPPRSRKPGSVGCPTGVDVAIMNDAGGLLPAGAEGEVVIRGRNVTRGYEKNPDANRNSFTDGWFRTGDQGRFDHDGYLFLTGRIKELIVRGGEKIPPREIDEALLSHPAVEQALGFALPDTVLGEKVAAAVVLKAGASASELELREHAARSLADFKVPEKVVFLAELPKGPTGKPQRIGLAEKLGLRGLGEPPKAQPTEYVAPRTDTETRLAEIWRAVLKVERAGVHDNFFDAGGDSILASMLITRIRHAFEVELSLPRLLESPTVAELAGFVDAQPPSAAAKFVLPCANRAAGVTLTPAQQRMWFLSQYAPEKPVYNRPFAYRLKGSLDLFRLQQSLSAVVKRHEILRTNYCERDGDVTAVVRDVRPVSVALVDFSGQPPEQRERAAVEWARQESERPFNLETDQGLHCGLARLAPDDHVLLLVMHYIGFDASSEPVLVRDLARAYDGTLADAPCAQYADYSAWLSSRQAEANPAGLAWWKQRLTGMADANEIPGDFARPQRNSYRGSCEQRQLDTAVLDRCKALARAGNTTVFAVLLAAFDALVHRYAGTEDVVVGTPVAVRNHPAAETMIGLFINTLVMRTSASGDPTFGEFLQRVRETVIDGLAHQEVPFDAVVDAVRPARRVAYSPLFQVMFEYRNIERAELAMQGISAERFEFDRGVAQFDLTLDIAPSEQGLRCDLYYNTDLFRPETAKRLLADFESILTAALQNPGVRLSSLPVSQAAPRPKRETADPTEEVFDPHEMETGDKPIPRRAPSDPVVLSFAQESLWFIHQLEPDLAAYNICNLLWLRGKVDFAALRGALEYMVTRHESLRTNIVPQEGAPVPVIREPRPFVLPVTQVTGGENEVHELARQASAVPFDLSQDVLLRAQVYQVSPEECSLLLVVHHICSDGWSMSVLLKELGASYAAISHGGKPQLPDLPLQFADFALWQRGLITGAKLQRDLNYWTKELGEVPSAPLLMSDRPRPLRQTYNGRRHVATLAPDLLARLKEFNRRERVTLYMTLLAALATLLHRHTGRDDPVIGCPIANRTRLEMQPLIGFFANTLAMRCRFDGDPTFREVLDRVRAKSLEAQQHQDLPFEKLVEILQPERSLSHTPIYQVMLSMQNVPYRAEGFGTLEAARQGFDERMSRVDLEILVEFRPEPTLVFHYNTDLFEHATIERMAGHLEALLHHAIESPGERVSRLRISSAEEQAQLLVWGRNRRPYPRLCIHEIFEERAAKIPEAIALLWGEQSLSYGELNRRANRLAHNLRAAGVRPGQRVGLLLPRSFHLLVAMLAVLKASAVYVPIDPEYPQARIDFMAEDCGTTVVLTLGSTLHRAPSCVRDIVDLDAFDFGSEDGANLGLALDPAAPAYCLYTSGSTGKPKGVEVPHCGVTRLVFAQDYAEFGPGEVWLQTSSMMFDVSALEIWGALLHGGRCALFCGPRMDAEQVGAAIRQHGVTSMSLTPSLFNTIIEEIPEALAPLRQLLIIGEALSVPHIRKGLRMLPRTRLSNAYGPTENSIITSCYRIPSELPPNLPSVPIGAPIANSECYILDAKGNLAAMGVPGELCAGGDGVAIQYVNRPELTAERFVTVTIGEESLRLYKTGDACRWLPGGIIEFLGRQDGQVKIRGIRIELGEIEAALTAHPAVRAAAVTVAARGDDKRLVGYIVCDVDVTSRQLRDFLRQRLPDFMVPSQYVFLGALPLTTSGKVDKRALPEVRESVEPETRPAATDEDLMRRVAEIWQSVLSVSQVRPGQDFFELGGHSLLATKLLARVERSFGVRVPVATLFQQSTLREFSDLVAARIKKLAPRSEKRSIGPLLWVGGGQELRELTAKLRPVSEALPIWIENEHWENMRPPFSVEGIASMLANIILARYPEGPYMIGGHCSGGVLAYETAQQLRTLGGDVALLVMVDAVTPKSRARLSHMEKLTARLQKELFHARNLTRTPLKQWGSYLGERLRELATWQQRRRWQSEHGELTAESKGQEYERILHLAMLQYDPGRYAGRVVYFQAKDRPSGRVWNSAREWRSLVGDNGEFHEIPGRHMTMLKTPNIEVLAERLRQTVLAVASAKNRKELPGARE